MCVSTMLIAGIARMYYGASAATVGPRLPAPADCRRRTLVRAQIALAGRASAHMPAEQKLDGEAVAVLEAWVKAK